MIGAISKRFRDLGCAQVNRQVSQFFADDHRRLDALLSAATVTPGEIDLRPFGIFRARLLRHIGMEEKLLFPALRAALGGAVEGLNNKAKLTTRKAYGFRSYRCIEIALYHTLGDLPEPIVTHRFC
jgi:hypothetical protein